MLLRHTSEKIQERKALTINPAKTCQPIGAMYAALGIHGCMPHSHGSQGCCSYHRSTLTRHYKEPVMSGTSSFTEGASVFGGQANLVQAIDNLFTIYDPQVIAVHTTCLSETIGDDIPQIVSKAKDSGKVPEGKHVIHCNTPSYVGSHVTGYANMVKAMVTYFAQNSGDKNETINLICGWVEPSDMREIKRLSQMLNTQIILFPDTSNVLDAPQTGKLQFYPKGGTTVDQLTKAGDSKYSIGLGKFSTEDAAKEMDSRCGVPFSVLDVPIGLSATDRFIMEMAKVTGNKIPDEITDERGRLVDMITDMQQYLYGKRVALWGDPDTIIPLTEFLVDLEMKPVYIVSGTPGKYFEKRITEIAGDRVEGLKVKGGSCADMFLMHQWIKNEPVDLLIGNTYGKYIARDEDIPLLRMGFPIMDRVGHSCFPRVGYNGSMRILEGILGCLMDRLDRDAPEESFELVM
ncbi:nitrogenase molybdenum-iron protein subunit beta [Chitinispirillales bacterium ANBcel5]|uniref:nitrogenase molybdenum-iron protein subunit beta n=1 Tax=Cellulosispirillum alkaliphilum TaxID=3039283 RepID=UPI002A56E7E8|nr:nitrogenase molybdenum-iron protein subunit beta [Chitinispirillales bacterium ANBcel5]